MGGRIKTWKKRWFCFDRQARRLAYYAGKPGSAVWDLGPLDSGSGHSGGLPHQIPKRPGPLPPSA